MIIPEFRNYCPILKKHWNNEIILILNQFLRFLLVAFFALFIGSQITEGVILVPYWKSLSSNDFYNYYTEFGPIIGKFYTILTIIAAIIPISLTFYCKSIKSKAYKFSVASSLFAILFIACFYLYFKEVNELFYQAALNEDSLKRELIVWTYWHWGRILIEVLSLFFLILTLIKLPNFKNK